MKGGSRKNCGVSPLLELANEAADGRDHGLSKVIQRGAASSLFSSAVLLKLPLSATYG